jgi:sugar phosphate isomerase/epimerase
MSTVKPIFPFRIGTTSYIIPDEIIPNVRYLANLVDDIELVLFEVDEGPNNLPDATAIKELQSLAAQHQLTYTVHLPLDLQLAGADGERHISLQKAQRVMACTRPLNPWAYVFHLEGKAVAHGADAQTLSLWYRQAVAAIEQVSAWCDQPVQLAVENLETYPLDFLDPVMQAAPIRRCIDIGHLWLDQQDAPAYLKRYLPFARVLHIHGIGERDHQSLRWMPAEQISAAIGAVLANQFNGVMTLEVFNQTDFLESLDCVHQAIQTIQSGKY